MTGKKILFLRKTRRLARFEAVLHKRDFFICLLSLLIGFMVGLLAHILRSMINLATHFFYFGTFSTADVQPSLSHWGWFSVFVPIVGGLLIGLMARFVSSGVYGHGIPETMEKILLNDSLIPKRMLFLKPVAASISVGTGGPFGDEGPIIATGGALGSAVGQVIHTTSYERKILLAAGVAGAVSAAFGSPVGGVFLAIELMLFELKPRSLIPAVLAAITADQVRMQFLGNAPAFSVLPLSLSLDHTVLICYFAMGLLIGLLSVGVTHFVHFFEMAFVKIPVHWMWYPAIGGIGVGLIGLIDPRVLGAGYTVITSVLNGSVVGKAAMALFFYKLLAWLVGIGSRTTAGTLAPLFLVGATAGVVLCEFMSIVFPDISISYRIAALVGMAALFTGVTRAYLASVFIVLESTHQFSFAIPVLTGCAASYIISLFFMQHTILTHGVVKKGGRIPTEEHTDCPAGKHKS